MSWVAVSIVFIPNYEVLLWILVCSVQSSALWSVAVGGVTVGLSGHRAIGALFHINTVDGCRGSWYWLCVIVY